jgi:hypothetical protein
MPATTAHGPRLRDNQTGLDCGTGPPSEPILIGTLRWANHAIALTNRQALWLVVGLIGVAVVLSGLLLMLGPFAHADEPGVGSLVCQQLELGYTPSQIAQQLHQGRSTLQRIPSRTDGLGFNH